MGVRRGERIKAGAIRTAADKAAGARAEAVIQRWNDPLALVRTGQMRETLAHYASQRPATLPKIGSANGDANGSQLGRSAVSCKTDLTFKRSLLRARLIYWDWLCRVASAKT